MMNFRAFCVSTLSVLTASAAFAGQPKPPTAKGPRPAFSRAFLQASPEILPVGIKFAVKTFKVFAPSSLSGQDGSWTEPVRYGSARFTSADGLTEGTDEIYCRFRLAPGLASANGSNFTGLNLKTFTVNGRITRTSSPTRTSILVPVSGVPAFTALECQKARYVPQEAYREEGQTYDSLATGPFTIDNFFGSVRILDWRGVPHVVTRKL